MRYVLIKFSAIPFVISNTVCSQTINLIAMTCTVSPFDRVRTALMNQPTDKKLYNGFLDCSVKLVQEGGILSLWRGFIPIWARFAPTVSSITIWEQICRLIWISYRKQSIGSFVWSLICHLLRFFCEIQATIQLLIIETLYGMAGLKSI